MSGTSFDGVHAAFLKTDGINVYKIGKGAYQAYKKDTRLRIQTLINSSNSMNLELMLETADEITKVHAETVLNLCAKQVDLVGFHGQTIYHNAQTKHSLQIGNAPLLEHIIGIKVITDFRRQDIAKGGEGAPLVPIYHKILCESLSKPIVVLNIGGIANITYIDSSGQIIAFDVGPGCALMDDFIFKKLGKAYDAKGSIAAQGKIHANLVKTFVTNNSFFSKKPPKALDRNQFMPFMKKLKKFATEDALATLVFLTVSGILSSRKFLPEEPKQWLVCGGGKHNEFLMKLLSNYLPTKPIESVPLLNGKRLDGDFIEAQAFGVLAARSYFWMPLR